jgi:hypothetical protein
MPEVPALIAQFYSLILPQPVHSSAMHVTPDKASLREPQSSVDYSCNQKRTATNKWRLRYLKNNWLKKAA